MADVDIEPSLPQPTRPAHNEQLRPSAPVQTAPEVYANEAQSLIAPTAWDMVKENLRLIRHNSPINTWQDASTEDLNGGVFLRQAAYYGLPGMRELGLDYQLTQQGRKKLTIEETRQIYPDATEPMHADIARGFAEDKRIVDSRKELIARYGMSGWKQFALSIPLGIVAGLTEPSNYALAPLMAAGTTAVGLGGAGLTSVFLANTVQNLAFEAAAAPQLKREGEEVTVASALTSSVIGGVVGTGIHVGVKALAGKGKGKTPPVGEDTPPPPPAPGTDVDTPPPPKTKVAKPAVVDTVPNDISQTRFAVALQQHESGQAINPAVGEAALQARLAGLPPPNTSKTRYEFTLLDDTGDRAFFGAGAGGEKLSLTGLGGDGVIELSDNKFRQNMFGDVAEVNLPPKLDLLDIDTPLKALPDIVQALETATGKKLPPMEADATIRTVLDNAKKYAPEDLEAIKTAVKQAGFDGYKYSDVDASGAPSHNGVILFDEGKATVVKHSPQDTSLVPKVSPDEVRAMLDSTDPAQTSPFYEPGIVEALAELDKTPDLGLDDPVKLHREQAAAAEKSLRSRIEAEPDKHQGVAEEMAEIQEQYKQDLKRVKMVKVLADCLGRGL